jgi:hypothetical protein
MDRFSGHNIKELGLKAFNQSFSPFVIEHQKDVREVFNRLHSSSSSALSSS